MNTTSAVTRRSLLGLFGAAGTGLAISACAGPGSTSNANPSTLDTSGKIDGKVSFAHWRAEDKEVFDKLIKEFVKKNSGASVTQDITPSNNYQTQALNRLKSGAIGDVFPTFRGAQFEQFVKAGVYTDLTGQKVVSNYTPALLEAGKSDGKQWGLPYQIVFPMPIANADLVSKIGVDSPPQDWQGFLDLCDKIKSKGIVPMAWPGGDPGNAGQLFNCMVMNEQPSDDSCAQIEAGKAKVTEAWFVDMLKKYAELRPYFQPNALGASVEPIQQTFASGKAAMLVTGSYHIAAVRALGAKFPIDLIPPITTEKGKPKYVGTYNSTFILGVNSASKVQPTAAAWLEFLSDPANASTYANETIQHVTVDGVDYTNKDLKRLAPWLTKKTMLAPRYQFNNLDIRNAVEGSCVSVVGGAKPEAAAKKAQQTIDQIVA